jgi:hypothetical protein
MTRRIIGNRMPMSSDKCRKYQQDRRDRLKREGCCPCGRKSSKTKQICPKCVRYFRDRFRRIKLLVIAAYGGCCVCCGETTYEFLSIDHKYNDGAEERRRLGRKAQPGLALMRLIIRENFPKRYQLLCFNCNMAKGFYGKCPHRK